MKKALCCKTNKNRPDSVDEAERPLNPNNEASEVGGKEPSKGDAGFTDSKDANETRNPELEKNGPRSSITSEAFQSMRIPKIEASIHLD